MPLCHVFLPPEKLAPLPLPLRLEDYSPLRFETVEIAQSETKFLLETVQHRPETQSLGPGSQAEWSLARRNAPSASTNIYVQRDDIVSREQAVRQFEEEERNSWEKSVIGHAQLGNPIPKEPDVVGRKLRQRKSDPVRYLDGPSIAIIPGSDPVVEDDTMDASGPSRRRSNRLGQARTSSKHRLPVVRRRLFDGTKTDGAQCHSSGPCHKAIFPNRSYR